ncbi:HNH endonuclease, partial [Mycobacterium sp. CBMA271]|uniref:HNH endonuclease signature motif containing protein n=1 Tax=Mycobacteroides sp. CBMA 271 TaxID=2606608 RepID=UPI001325E101
YLCEVHHIHEWAHGGTTDIDRLTFACPAHHRLLSQGWTTRKQRDGTTEWIPPPQLKFGDPVTDTHHHPEQLTPAY